MKNYKRIFEENATGGYKNDLEVIDYELVKEAKFAYTNYIKGVLERFERTGIIVPKVKWERTLGNKIHNYCWDNNEDYLPIDIIIEYEYAEDMLLEFKIILEEITKAVYPYVELPDDDTDEELLSFMDEINWEIYLLNK